MPAQAKRNSAQRAAKSRPAARLGALPEWNLADLYAGIDDPQVKRDLDRADAESVAFEQLWVVGLRCKLHAIPSEVFKFLC